MSSHKPDRGRIPRLRDPVYQSRSMTSPTINASTRPSGSSLGRSQIAKPMNLTSRTGRSSSLSDAEAIRPILAISNPSKIPSAPGNRSLSLPRAPIVYSPSNSNLPLSTPSTADRIAADTINTTTGSKLSDSTGGKPSKVLRRRAPTIGQHSESNKSKTESPRPEKLTVIIPSNTRPGHVRYATPQSAGAELIKQKSSSPSVPQDNGANEVTDQQLHHGPKELASLRATVKTQTPIPPTPNFAYASSPSTMYSGSPGIWSRTSTPTSLSSHSPGIVQSMKVRPRFRHPTPSQTRLPAFSPPMTQSTPQSDRIGSNATRLPTLVSRVGSSSSSVNDDLGESLMKVDSANTFTSRNSPIQSSLPRTAKSNLQATPNTEVEKKSSPQELRRNLGTEAIRSTVSDSVQVPSRPSREGTHYLELEPSPVIKSNLSPNTMTSHKRRGSSSSSLGGSHLVLDQSAATSVDSLHSRSLSRIPSRTPTSPEVLRKSPRTLTKEPKRKQEVTSPDKPRRFGLFPKKSKPDMSVQSQDESRAARKGPAAGTGHEGYGKYGQRGRKPSVSSNSGARARSTSTTRSTPKSVSSSKGGVVGRPELELDGFLLDRLEPVVITGGGMDGAALVRTQSGQSTSSLSTVSTSNPVKPFKGSPLAGYSSESLATSTATGGREPRDSYQSNPAHGATPPRLQTSDPVRVPFGGNTEKPDLSMRHAGFEVSQLPVVKNNQGLLQARSAALHIEEADGLPDQTKKQTKSGKGIKWNFFQRSHATGHKRKGSTPKAESGPPAPQLHATVSPVSVRRPVAHYALVDAELEPLDEIIHNIKDSPPTEESEEASSPVEVPATLSIRKASQSILLPSPPKLHGEFSRDRPASPKVYFKKDPMLSSPEKSVESQRPIRLASVGRIPQVMSRRDRQHKPALQSFSRPFSMADFPSLAAPVSTEPSMPSLATLNTLPNKIPNQTSNLGFDLTQPFGNPGLASALDLISGPYSKHEFLAFYPRKDSMFSNSSGSESLAAVTAVIPDPGSEPTEDEVWGEYDDFIDHVLSSPETSTSAFPGKSDADEKFGLATMASKALQAELNANTDRRDLPALSENPTVALTPASPRSSGDSFRLRRSRIVSALHSSYAPSSQPSFSDIIARYYEDQDENYVSATDPDSESKLIPPVEQSSALLSSSSLNLSESFEACRQRNTILFDIAERDREGPTAQTNLRSGSLMTSRWLSFGRVLFSPAHKHVKNGEQERILLVDGLGNDDWSFYCALTYPNADVYCINDGPAPTASKHPAAWQPPANHHTVHHTSLENRFAFPKGFFTVTVLRFPAACPEHVQNNIVSECKRVLRPGGYMEMSIIDLDMVNMGAHTRKAVRKLKEKTYLSDANISLKPASDNIQRLLGRHGFDNLRRCLVRIPVAGIVRSSTSSSSTTSSNPSILAPTGTPSTSFSALTSSSMSVQRAKAHGKSPSNETDLSLGDLLSDPSPSPSNDESIRKIVARVGRWWYTRCYEIPVLPNGDADQSIWADKKVLRECQKRGTGFRLLIAYAQNPSEVNRRTASV